jgi:hypothetical protein
MRGIPVEGSRARPRQRRREAAIARSPAAGNGFGGYAGSLALAGGNVIAAGFDGYLVALPAR